MAKKSKRRPTKRNAAKRKPSGDSNVAAHNLLQRVIAISEGRIKPRKPSIRRG